MTPSLDSERETVSMTWPQYLRNECTYLGQRLRLPPAEASILCLLMLRRGQHVGREDMVEFLYPDPFCAPEWEWEAILVQYNKLNRKIGRLIETNWKLGRILPLPSVALARAA